MCFQVFNCFIFVFQFSLKAVMLQSVFSYWLLLWKLCAVKTFICITELFDLVWDQVQLVKLLRNFLRLFFAIGLQISFFVLKRLNLIILLHELFLQIRDLIFTFGTGVLFVGVVSSLHLRLFQEHSFLDFIDLLLFFNFHLINNSSIFLAQLLDIIHELFICFTLLLTYAFKIDRFLI